MDQEQGKNPNEEKKDYLKSYKKTRNCINALELQLKQLKVDIVQPSIEYDENTDSYYEDTYPKAKPGSWMSNDIGKWYQLENGSYYTNVWVRIDGKRYFFDENGYMKIGWIQLGNNWYYTDDTGVMVTGERRIDGITYNFNAYGVMKN